jgi:pantoate--beta-alanine ligase|tara:strand:- start:53 stop:928 length:876 start_codon:yes stop_codon:yes gene_type:complete
LKTGRFTPARFFLHVKTIISSAAIQRQALRWQREGVQVVLVPTMGALHAGHMSLIRLARKIASINGIVVVSIYVNPPQFDNVADLRKYPRKLAVDKRACKIDGVDVVFAPKNLYARGTSVFVDEDALTNEFEGRCRPGHFSGVMTVVAKLFNLVQPGHAVFGEKDFQQTAVLQRMVRDLNMPVKIDVGPTMREADGLALSSRNIQLKGSLRQQAAVLWQAICVARAAGNIGADHLKRRLKRLIENQPDVSVDYVEFIEAVSFRPVKRVTRGVRLLLAANVGGVRLIDNAKL